MKQEKDNNHQEFWDDYKLMIQPIKISCELSREEIYELGRKCPYHLYYKFPINIKTIEHPYFTGMKIIQGL